MAVATSAAGVVGTYNVPGSDPFATRRAFLWRPGKPVQTIAATPGASADGINDAGVVAGTLGWGYPDAAPLRSYRAWTWRAGTPTRLGSLGGGSTPNDINNAGQVVGTSFVTATRMDPYLFSAGRMTPLRTGGRTSVTAQAINDQGVVVGTDGDYQLAVRWASPTSVPVALPLPAGMTWSQGQDVNNAGLTVGSVSGEVTNPRRVIFKAAIWR